MRLYICDPVKLVKDGFNFTYVGTPSPNACQSCFILLDSYLYSARWETTSKDGGYGYDTGYFFIYNDKGKKVKVEPLLWILSKDFLSRYNFDVVEFPF